MLLTKGDREEQQRTVDASGIAHHFREVRIVPEKDTGVYRGLAVERMLPPETTWMIGNSPRSDILPALAAGLSAVFIPNANTWVLELDDTHDIADTAERVLRLGSFPELLHHF